MSNSLINIHPQKMTIWILMANFKHIPRATSNEEQEIPWANSITFNQISNKGYNVWHNPQTWHDFLRISV